MSVTLSTSVVIVSDSTGSRPIVSNSLMTEPFARGPRPRTTEDKHPGGKERGAGYVGRPPEATDHRSPHRSLALSARAPPGRPATSSSTACWSACSSDSATRPPAGGYATRSAACHQPRASLGFPLADAWHDDGGFAVRWSSRATGDPHLSRGGMTPAAER